MKYLYYLKTENRFIEKSDFKNYASDIIEIIEDYGFEVWCNY